MASASTHSWGYYNPVGARYPIEDRVAEEEKRTCPVKQPLPDVLSSRESKSMRFTPGYPMPSIGELVYFPLRARGEFVRFLLHYAGLSYTFRCVTMEEWQTLKADVPGGCLPAFVPCDMGEQGEMFSGTMEIAKYIAAQADDKPGLLPADSAGAALAEKLFSFGLDPDNKGPTSGLYPVLNFISADEANAKLEATTKAAIAAFKTLDADLKSAAPFFGGAAPCWGEFALFLALDTLCKLDAKALTTLGPAWSKYYEAVSGLRGIKEYLKVRPKAGSGKVGMPSSLIATKPLDD